jgi:hypothetical protein
MADVTIEDKYTSYERKKALHLTEPPINAIHTDKNNQDGVAVG